MSSPVYNQNIPQSPNFPANNQSQIKDNFFIINESFSVNHTPLTDVSNQGYHTKINFNGPLLKDPGLPQDNSSIYTKAPLANAEGDLKNPNSFLFFQNDVNAQDVFQLTQLILTDKTQIGIGPIGFKTPWGLTINCGTMFNLGNETQIPYAVNFTNPPYTLIIEPLKTFTTNYAEITDSQSTFFKFKVRKDNGSLNNTSPILCYFLAIGI